MSMTDIFVRRPVLSSVVSFLILVVGLGAAALLPVRQYPNMENTEITITTSDPGANQQLVQGFITRPLEQAIGTVDGIDYMLAQSTDGTSTISVYVRLNYDANEAMTDISAAINSVLYLLPASTQQPILNKTTGVGFPDYIMAFTSPSMNPMQISAYISNVITPKLNGINGISQVQIWGNKPYAMRIWLDPTRLASLNLTPTNIATALAANSILASAGKLKGKQDYISINAQTDLHDETQFNNLVIKTVNGKPIRIKDVGEAKLGAQNYDHNVVFEGKTAVFAAISTAPDANPLTVVNGIYKLLPSLSAVLPSDLAINPVYDSTTYIRAAIEEVLRTIIEAAIIVFIIIFISLGSFRAVFIPLVTIPLSLVGVCFLMSVMSFSFNLLTFLAMVIAIGLVVDDAIVVVENIFRHIEEGQNPLNAAILGAREITRPIILMTLTLAAVFAPIGFVGGITGVLFKEFAFTLAASVIISGVIALTLSPMLCSKFLYRDLMHKPFVKRVDASFDKIKRGYMKLLGRSLNQRYSMLLIGIGVAISSVFFFTMIPTELAPTEDQSWVGFFSTAPSTANLNYLLKFNPPISKILESFPQRQAYMIVNGNPSLTETLGGLRLKNWDQRKESAMQIAPQLQVKLNNIPGFSTFTWQRPALPGVPAGPPLNFVLVSTSDYPTLFNAAAKLVDAAKKSGLFLMVDTDLKFDNPQLQVAIDRSKAADMGITMAQIASALAGLYSENYVNLFSMENYSYQVIPQVPDAWRNDPKQLSQIQISTSSGGLIPLSNLLSFSYTNQPASLNEFQQLNSDTIQAVLKPGVTLGQVLNYFNSAAKSILPSDITWDYGGQSRQYVQESSALVYAFGFAFIIIFLMLAAQFESYSDAIIILAAVPLSMFGALLPLFFGVATINIYTEIGLIALVGLISKHGILMVEFAKLQQESGRNKFEAIKEAAGLRLRAILMTTAAMVFGVSPLIVASGAGAVSRHDLGVVIASGMLIGTFFTLFVVPSVYTFLARTRKPGEHT